MKYLNSVTLVAIYFVVFVLLVPAMPLEAQDSNSPQEETQYKDPFAEEATPPTAVAPAPSSSASPAPSSTGESSFENSRPAEAGPAVAPSPESAPAPAPVAEPTQINPSTTPEIPFEERPLIFPGEDRDAAPVTQSIFEKERRDQTKTIWNLGFDLGIAMNMNRRQQQINFAMSGGYRFWPEWELDLSLYYRAVKDTLLGFVGEARYIWIFSNSPSVTWKLLPVGGLGWTLRMVPSGSKFSESRFSVRVGAQCLAYFLPQVAAVGGLVIDSYVFGYVSGQGAQNLMSHGGAPTQALLSFGARWDF